MRDGPLVSIIVPTYDRSYFLRTRALASVARQTYTNWEVLVVGDGPADDRTRSAVQSMGDARFRYLEIPRIDYSGLSAADRWCVAGAAARNHGIDAARGDIIAPLDDDDEFFPAHLEESIEAIQDGADLVYGSVVVRDIQSGTERRDFIPWSEERIRQSNILYHSSVCYSRRLAGFRYPTTGSDPADYAFWLDMLSASPTVRGLESNQAVYYGDSRFRYIRSSLPSLPPIEQFHAATQEIFSSRMLSNGGPWCSRLEKAVAERVGVRHAVAAPSGDAALRMALHAVSIGAGARREVILPSYTFPATANAVCAAGLEPVFCDVDGGSLTLSPASVASMMSDRTLAVLPVHAHGNPADMPALETLARDAGVMLVADAAAAFGAVIGDRAIGSFGDVELFSMSGTKVLAAGEGGMVCTNSDELCAQVRRVARYGVNADYWCETTGINGKLAELPAALACLGLPLLDGWLEERQLAAREYERLFSSTPDVRTQHRAHRDARSAWKDFPLVFSGPEVASHVVAHLKAHDIDSRPYYRPLHGMPPFAHCRLGDLAVTEQLVDSVVCIPMYSSIRPEIVHLVTDVILDALDTFDMRHRVRPGA